MKIRDFAYAVVAIGGATALWWTGTLARAMQSGMQFVVANPLAATIALFGTALIAAILTLTMGRRLCRSNREMHDVLRVARQNADQTVSIRVSAAAKPAATTEQASQPKHSERLALPSSETPLLDPFPHLSVIDGGLATPGNDFRLTSLSGFSHVSLSKSIYFQPVVDLIDGQILAYQVSRRINGIGSKAPQFTQGPIQSGVHALAEFQYELAKQVMMNSRRFFSDLNESAARIHVPVSTGLINDDTLWNPLMKLAKAHVPVLAGLVFIVDDQALAKGDEKIDNRLIDLHQMGAEIGVGGFDFHFESLKKLAREALFVAVGNTGDLDAVGEKAQRKNICLNAMLDARIPVAINHIASETDVVDALEAGGTLGCGNLFGPPRRLKGDGPDVTLKNRA